MPSAPALCPQRAAAASSLQLGLRDINKTTCIPTLHKLPVGKDQANKRKQGPSLALRAAQRCKSGLGLIPEAFARATQGLGHSNCTPASQPDSPA